MKQFIVRCITHHKQYPQYHFENEFYVEADNTREAQKTVKTVLPKVEVLDHINKIKEVK